MSEKKFYWLKLDRDFFKRHDVTALQRLCGAEAVNLYLWLLCESANHEGKLRFSKTTPYNARKIYLATGIEEEHVKLILEALVELDLMQIEEDGTLFLTHLSNMVGFDTSEAIKKRDYRERRRQGEDNTGTSEDKKGTKKDNVPNCPQMSGQCPTEKEIEKEIEIEIEIEKDKVKDKSFTFKRETATDDGQLPTFEKFSSIFEKTLGYLPSDLQGLYDYLKKNNIKNWKLAMINWGTGAKQ